MDTIENLFLTLDSYLGSATYFPFALLLAGVFFTVYLKAPQLRFFSLAWSILRGKRTRAGAPGDTTHFQALSTALSGTVGTGNVAGVAFAIHLGGPAALFWMWVTAFVGMTTKLVEVTASHNYRKQDESGRIAGGPMYYMEYGLGLKWLAVFFAAALIVSSFGSGNMPQSNNVAQGLEVSFGVPTFATGLVFASVLALVIIGGIHRIARVAARLVPLMAVLYAIGALGVAATNAENILPSLSAVFADAFNGSAATGGFLGASFAYAFNRGVNRGLFSNEAGQGSAPIAHAAAKTDEPVAEGIVAILEPFIDTMLLCTLTGVAILSSGVWTEKFETEFDRGSIEYLDGSYTEARKEHADLLANHLAINPPDEDPVKRLSATIEVRAGLSLESEVTVLHNRSIAEDVRYYVDGNPYSGSVEVREGSLVTPGITVSGKSLLHSVPLTAEAFKRSVFGGYGQYFVTICLVLFAFSTALAWSYYGDRAVTYLFGLRWVNPYRCVYVAAFFAASVVDTSIIWTISMVTIALITLPNLFGLLLMVKEVRSLIETYEERQRG